MTTTMIMMMLGLMHMKKGQADYDDNFNDDDVDIVRADAHMKKGHLGSPPGSPLS